MSKPAPTYDKGKICCQGQAAGQRKGLDEHQLVLD